MKMIQYGFQRFLKATLLWIFALVKPDRTAADQEKQYPRDHPQRPADR